jgi:RP/EB family microtubule-associated protein
MEGAYFVGRKEVVDFINSTLELNLSKIEDTASGAVACQLLDIMYPNTVPMNKVNWSVSQSYEYVANYKILQTCFTKLHIDRNIDVDRLIKASYMDNLEFMQWFKRFFEMQVSDKGNYDCQGQRARGKGGAAYNTAHGGRASSSAAPSRIASAAPKSSVLKRPAAAATKNTPPPPPAVKSSAPASTPAAAAAASSAAASAAAQASSAAAVQVSNAAAQESAAKVSALTAELEAVKIANEESTKSYTELRQEMDGLEKERDFYFDKLRDIEILLQDVEDSGKGTELTASIFKILYATADGFEQAGDAAGDAAESAENAEAPAAGDEGENETY